MKDYREANCIFCKEGNQDTVCSKHSTSGEAYEIKGTAIDTSSAENNCNQNVTKK